MRIFISLARNIFNTDAIQAFAEKLSSDPEVLLWLKGPFRKWLLSDDGPAVKVTKVSADSPQWAQIAAAKGELFDIDYGSAEDRVRPVLDYFSYLKAQNKRFERMSFADADTQQRTWHEELANKAGTSVLAEDGIAVLKMYDDGYSWVKVFGESSLNREGEEMGHCVGSYFQQVSEGATIIYSLRDRKNGAHVTVEYNGRNSSIDQIKGKANKSIIAKYRPYVKDFLSLLNFRSVETDESGLTAKDVRDVVKLIPAAVHKLEYNGTHFKHSVPQLPIIVAKHSDRKKLSEENVTATFGKSTIVLSENRIGRFKLALSDQALDMLEYCQVHSICGFSLYSRPWASDPLVVKAYEPKALALSTYTQVVGTTKFRIAKQPGAFWAMPGVESSDNISVVALTKSGKLALALSTAGGVRLRQMGKFDKKIAQDLVEWAGKRQIKFMSMKSNESTRSMIEFLGAGIKSPSSKVLSAADVLHMPALKAAFEVFSDQIPFVEMVAMAKAADRLTSYTQYKAFCKKEEIKMSGFLYYYFPSFLVLLLMKNKELAFDIIANYLSLGKQFDAFTCAPSSITSGAWSRHVKDLGLHYHQINIHMKQLMPWTKKAEFTGPSLTKMLRIQKRFYSK